MSFISLKTKQYLYQIKDIILSILPQNRQETVILFILISIYFSFSVIIALNTKIIEGAGYRGFDDLYFSFDNASMYNNGVSNIASHPLLKIIVQPFLYLGTCFSIIFDTQKGRVVFTVLFCNYLVASSVIYIYRYLRTILDLKGYLLYLITFLYAFYSATLFLSFTIESFTLSLFSLSFIVYYYSVHIKQKEKIPLFSNTILALLAGGITMTNFIKGIIPILFTNERKKEIIKRIILISFIFFIIIVINEIALGAITEAFRRFSVYRGHIMGSGEIYEHIIDFFLGSPILLPSIKVVYWYHVKHDTITMNYYHAFWQYIPIFIMYASILLSIIYSWKNKLFIMLLLFWSCDIFLHLVIQLGIGEAYLYAGHWIYLLPLFLGWFATRIPPKFLKSYIIILSITTIIIVVNNFILIRDFINLAIDTFPYDPAFPYDEIASLN